MRLVGSTRSAKLWAAAVLCSGVAALAVPAAAARQSNDPADYRWERGAIDHAQRMRQFFDADQGAQPTPRVIPQLELDVDPSGAIATYQPNGPRQTAGNAFFQDLGTNGRTCLTCHQPQNAWTVSASSVQARFFASFGRDPIFRIVDGATCPSDDVSSFGAKLKAYRLLMSKGLLRIGLPMPSPTQFEVVSVDDPYHCNTNPTTGLTSPTTGFVSVYRRPLPATNLGFLSAIMWDGREPSLASQAKDATLGHAQANVAPSDAQLQQIVDFETGTFSAQMIDRDAGYLDKDEATGGPIALSQLLAGFFIGINDPFGLNPQNTAFTSFVFDLYDSWDNLSGKGEIARAREAVARGEAIFNTMPINISHVAGINDALNQANVSGFCGTCHNTPNIGDHSIAAALDIGVADAGIDSPPELDIADLPVFTLRCMDGPLAGKTFIVTDPGRALISGNCADIGKLKGPILRGLAARAPYFHNGSAASLMDVVDFYDKRFGIGFTEQQKRDLVAFLKTL
jgi:cytochrome c peroxidase